MDANGCKCFIAKKNRSLERFRCCVLPRLGNAFRAVNNACFPEGGIAQAPPQSETGNGMPQGASSTDHSMSLRKASQSSHKTHLTHKEVQESLQLRVADKQICSKTICKTCKYDEYNIALLQQNCIYMWAYRLRTLHQHKIVIKSLKWLRCHESSPGFKPRANRITRANALQNITKPYYECSYEWFLFKIL